MNTTEYMIKEIQSLKAENEKLRDDIRVFNEFIAENELEQGFSDFEEELK